MRTKEQEHNDFYSEFKQKMAIIDKDGIEELKSLFGNDYDFYMTVLAHIIPSETPKEFAELCGISDDLSRDIMGHFVASLVLLRMGVS